MKETYKGFVERVSPDLSRKDAIVLASMGLAGEVGELVDSLKKVVFYDKALDMEHTKEEMGDILWYLQYLMNTLSVTLEEVQDSNVRKLNKRYPNGFTKTDAIARADKDPSTDDVK